MISCEAECYRLEDCPFDKQCQGTPGKCVDPCTNNVETGRPPCGVGADCVAKRYKAICSCPKTHTGDPFVSCRPFTKADLCNPNPCGPNAFCEPGIDNLTGEDRPVCLCEPGYRGNGVTGCTRGDCVSLNHNQCPNDKACYDSTCIDPCSPTFCGGDRCCNPTANCRAVDHKAECSCPPGTEGDPRTGGRCRAVRRPIGSSSSNRGSNGVGNRFEEAECYKLSDCAFDKQCQGIPGRCVDPCTNNVETGRPPCGVGADCVATRYKAICSCPKTHTGDPFVSCRPFTKDDLCNPNPCGPNSFCEPGVDNLTGEDRPVCLCNPGYRGNGVIGCSRGDCVSLNHNQCPNDRACYDSTCVDPCGPTFCGGGPCCNPTANCRGVDHKAECSCPPGTEGEPRTGGTCRASSRTGVAGTRTGCSTCGSGSSSGSLCDPNPCGQDAECNIGSDRSGQARPICTCPRGYSGNALVACRRGECFNDSECPDHLACFDYKCKDPCKGPDTSCGVNAQCKVVNHGAICSCPQGYQGDPVNGCFRSRRG